MGTALGIPSHWELAYTRSDAELNEYFARVHEADELRRLVFAKTGDPLQIIVALLKQAWPGPVMIAIHPKTGRQFYAGIIRSGAPKLHFDNARYDVSPPLNCVSQLGLSIHLQSGGSGGHLKVYRGRGKDRGNTVASGRTPVGNYDLPYSSVEGLESDVIPCEPGDLVVTPNRLLHEVTPCERPDERLTVAAHIALMVDGSLALFS